MKWLRLLVTTAYTCMSKYQQISVFVACDSCKTKIRRSELLEWLKRFCIRYINYRDISLYPST